MLETASAFVKPADSVHTPFSKTETHSLPVPEKNPAHVVSRPQGPTKPVIEPTHIQTIPPTPSYTTAFTKEISASLARCGLNLDYINPEPIGEGANHKVYMYQEPDQPARVVKVAKPSSITTMSEGEKEEVDNIKIAYEYFKDFGVKTEIKTDPQDRNFSCIIQDAIDGEPITNKMIKEYPEAQKQLAEIVKLNADLHKKENMSLDFVGMPGFEGWLRRQVGKLFLRKSEFEVSNVLMDKNGKLKIIDFEFFKFSKDIPFTKRFVKFFGFAVNRILMKHYFGLDIKKG